MEERSAMQRWFLVAFVALCAAAVSFDAAPARAGSPDRPADRLELSSQATTVERRPRIRVTPRYPRRKYHSLYPLPHGIDYPGPGAVRQCVSRLVPEYRPSGTVIVPRMRCWWARL
jgi:hypothetical protein